MKVTINLFDVDSIRSAVDELEKYEKKLKELPQKVAQRACDEGYNVARANIPPISDQNQPALLSKGGSGNVYTIEAGGCLPYVEFGTGVVGQNGGYPETEYLATAGWEYANSPHVFTTKKGRTGWFWFDNSAGHYRFTEGIAPGAFLYETVQYLKREIPNMAREELKKDG